jgi:hypothetical protein
MTFDQLKQFRTKVYSLLGNGKDALFDLMDAVLVRRSVYSFVELSVSPVFRRKWSSIYEAIEDSLPPGQEWMQLYTAQLPQTEQLILAGDHTAWPRPNARTLKDRTYEHQAQLLSGGKAVTVGQGYSTIAWVPGTGSSWALPLLHERITSFDSPIAKAAAQLKLVCQHLPKRPISLWDAEYGCASFVKQTGDVAADKLMRLRPNRVLYGAPKAYTGFGRPRVHGDKFKLNDSTTWWLPDQTIEVNHPKLGQLRLRLWCALHFQQSAQHSMNLIRVERLNAPEQRQLKPLWLIWVGKDMPELAQIWHQYLRRFAIDHWYRFIKQRLHWTVPHFATPEQSERWSDLMPQLTWQLWLARTCADDCPLPWQQPSNNALSPGRVANSFAAILARIGTPAVDPKPRGKSPGWPEGQPRSQRIRDPIVKKGTVKPKKQLSKSA